MPHLGINAIYKAASAIGRLEQFSFKIGPHPLLGAPTLDSCYPLHANIIG
jgi:succinyl-diaminopimelate desuccinylase